jgi:hypothetical protein
MTPLCARSIVVAAALLGAGCSMSLNASAYLPQRDGGGAPSVQLAAEILPPTGSSLVRQEVAEVSFDDTGHTTLRLLASVQLQGTVVDESGAAVIAQVVVTRPSAIPGRPDVVAQAATDDNGAFSLAVLPGDQVLRAIPQSDSAAKSPPATFPVTVGGSAGAMRFQILPRDGAVAGRVTDALGAGIGGLTVRVVDHASGELLSSVVQTDGAYCAAADPGCFRVLLSPDAVDGTALDLVADGGALPVKLSRPLAGVDLTGSVDLAEPPLPSALLSFTLPVLGQSPSGTTVPVAGAEVRFTAHPSTATAVTAADFASVAFTDADGNAIVPLLPGSDGNRDYDVTVAPPADAPFAPGHFPIAVGAQAGVLGAVTLGVRPTVVGRVATPSGAPAAGVLVSPAPADRLAVAGPGYELALPQTATDGTGAFLLRLDSGLYDLDLVPPPSLGLARWSIDGVRVDGDVSLDAAALPPAVNATVAVVSAAGAPASGVEVRLYATDDPSCLATNRGCHTARLRGDGVAGDDGAVSLLLASPPP